MIKPPGNLHRRNRDFAIHLGLLLTYLVLAIVLTYPLITSFTTHVVGRNIDEATFVWNLWWVKHAIIDLGTSPLYTDFIFYPLGIGLVFYTLTLFNGLVSMPLLFFTSPIVANNVVYLLSLTLSGFGAFLLARYLLNSYVAENSNTPLAAMFRKEGATLTLASFAGGLVFAFSSSQFVYASLGQPNLTSTAWIPFYALFLIKTVRESRQSPSLLAWRQYLNPCLAGLFLAFAVLTELTYSAFLLTFTALYLAAASVGLNRGLRPIANLVVRLAVLVATFVLIFSPILVSAWREIAGEGEYLSSHWGYADAYSADLLGFFIPTYLHPVFGDWVKDATSTFTDINIVFVGYASLALAVIAAIRYWRTLWFWVVSGALYLVFTLGPLLHINGVSTFDFDGLKANFPLPYIMLHYIPLVKANRIPNRFSIMLTLALAVLVAFAIAWLIGKVQGRMLRNSRAASLGLFGLLSAAILFERLSLPLPLNDMTAPEVYQQIAADPGDFAIMQLPLGWRNSYGMLGTERTIIQSYQTVHQKRMLGGNISRNPDFKFAYFGQVPFLKTIVALEEGKPVDGPTRQRDAGLASQVTRLYDVKYVVVHREYVKPEVEEYVRQALALEKFYDIGGVAGYRVPVPTASAAETIDFGKDDTAMYRGEGWSSNETLAGNVDVNWATKKEARVFFSAYGRHGVTLRLRMIPFVYGGMSEQTAAVVVNGKDVVELKLKPDWEEYKVDVPASTLREGLNELRLRLAYAASPNQVIPGNYAIGGTKVRSPVDLTVQSAGMNAGNYAYIKVDGKETGKNGRGYNLVAIEPGNGKVLRSAAFDTFSAEAESERMAETIEALPTGTIVALAAKDDASQKLTDRARRAIESLGAKTDLRGKYRWSHGLVGVKGAQPGEAAEVASEQAAYVHIGANPDTRTLAAAVDYIRTETQK